MADLTAEEIAELRASLRAGLKATPNTALRAEDAIRLLDEVEQSRTRQRDHVTVMGIAHTHANDLKAQIERLRGWLRWQESVETPCPECGVMAEVDGSVFHLTGCRIAAELGET